MYIIIKALVFLVLLVFGTRNAGTQCVAMSWSALIFNFRNAITSLADLVEILNIGKCLYSTLSKSVKETLLLFTDLPAMVSLFESNYQLTYSESYSGVLNGDSFPIANFPYVMSLADAFCFIFTKSIGKHLVKISTSFMTDN